MNRGRSSSLLIVILLLAMLFTGLVNICATAQTSSGFINSSTPSAASVNLPVIATGAVSTSTAKKYVVFRDDDVGFGNLSALEAVDQVHIDENVPVTLAVIPHPNPCGTGNELLQDTPVTNYLLSIVNNPLFEFAQHGYNHYDYADNGAPTCSASSAGAGVPQVVGPAGPYYEVGESPGPAGQLVGATYASEFRGRPYADQFNAINQGRQDMIQALGVTPTTFIPPFDSGDQSTLKAATALGFTLYSTGPGDFNVNDASLDGIMVQASSIGLGWSNYTAWKTGMQSVTQATDAALNNATAGESIVVAYHFWTFEAPGGSPDPARIALFRQYIDHLKSRGDVIFATLGGQPLMNPSPAPAVSSQDGNRLDVFAQGTYRALWNKYYQSGSGWSAWESLGGTLTSSPAATSPGNGTIDVFARGTTGALYGKTTANNGASWSNWYPIGGQLASGTGPAADARGPNSFDVFVQGTDHLLWYTHWDGTKWSAWKSLGGTLTSSPAATSPGNGTIDVFARGTTGALYEKTTTNSGASWSGWTSLGGQIPTGTGPAVCSWSAGRLDVFVQGTDGILYHKWDAGGSWSKNWESLGGTLTSSPAATSPGNGTIDVFARGTTGAFYEKTFNNGWYAWTSIGNAWS